MGYGANVSVEYVVESSVETEVAVTEKVEGFNVVYTPVDRQKFIQMFVDKFYDSHFSTVSAQTQNGIEYQDVRNSWGYPYPSHSALNSQEIKALQQRYMMDASEAEEDAAREAGKYKNLQNQFKIYYAGDPDEVWREKGYTSFFQYHGCSRSEFEERKRIAEEELKVQKQAMEKAAGTATLARHKADVGAHAAATAEHLWCKLFGNQSDKRVDSTKQEDNSQQQYLTEASCKMIFEYLVGSPKTPNSKDKPLILFENGIDFGHLPDGFFMNRNENPAEGGKRNVLDYSPLLAVTHPREDPCSVQPKVQDQPGAKDSAPMALPMEPPMEQPMKDWYDFLKTKIKKENGDIYCSEAQLRAAFDAFEADLKKLGLAFYSPIPASRALSSSSPSIEFFNTSFFKKDFNPIVLLGRWQSIMTNPHLKEKDKEAQWKALLDLDLTNGFGPIRVLSDHLRSPSPCGFVIPEMSKGKNMLGGNVKARLDKIKLKSVVLPGVTPLKTDKAELSCINSEGEFWAYLSFLPARNSIEFYRKAIASIREKAPDISDKDFIAALKLLAGSTTGENYDEVFDSDKGLEAWHTLLDRTWSYSQMDPVPNLVFLSSLRAEAAQAPDTERALVEKLTAILKKDRVGCYQGAKFYLVESQWQGMTMVGYLDFVFNIIDKQGPLAKMILPCFSALGIKSRESPDYNRILEAIIPLDSDPIKKDALKYFFSVLPDVNQPLETDELIKLIQNLPATRLETLAYLEKNCAKYFHQDFFKEKRDLIQSAQLNSKEHANINALGLLEEQQKRLIKIEAALKAGALDSEGHRIIQTEDLGRLNDLFYKMTLYNPDDIPEFIERLTSIEERFLPKSKAQFEEFLRMIETVITQPSLDDFNQIFFYNLVEPCTDEFLIEKMTFFMQTLRPMLDRSGVSSTNIQGMIEWLALVTMNTPRASLHEPDFTTQLEASLKTINSIIKDQPQLKSYLFTALSGIGPKNSPEYFPTMQHYISSVEQSVDLLHRMMPDKEKVICFNLLANFQKRPGDFTQLWAKISELDTDEKKAFILPLLNYFKNDNITDLGHLIDALKDDQKFKLIKEHAKSPPYPKSADLVGWVKDEQQFKEQYARFDKIPFGERVTKYAFSKLEYAQKRKAFERVDPKLFIRGPGTRIERLQKQYRDYTSEQLREEFNQLKGEHTPPLKKEEAQKLLCCCLETLARTTSQEDPEHPGVRISQEFNTTQVMALYSMLMNPGKKLMTEIDTGEGKSRISMVLAACQVAQGKTVDFMTSDMQLAERDYLQYNDFFTALGIGTSLVSLNTPEELYQKGGVNFTDTTQLILLRNKSDIDENPQAYLDVPGKRCLIMDEFDKFRHDKMLDSFNLARRSKELARFVWIYPVLVEFMEKMGKESKDPLVINDALKKQFIDYIRQHGNLGQLTQINELNEKSPQQILTWLQSAKKALDMQENVDYRVTDPDKLVLMRDAKDRLRQSRQIISVQKGRFAEGTYDKGVHQCLCAIENAKEKKRSGKSEAFIIQPETVTLRTLFASTFLATYNAGTIFGLSGTSRAKYYAGELINYLKYAYLKIPRHHELKREDKNVWGAKDANQQFKFIKRAMLEKLRKTPPDPILLICKNDEDSARMLALIQKDKTLMRYLQKAGAEDRIARVDAGTDKEAENEAIKSAGNSGKLTLSTVGMFGRGVDIFADNLYVLCDFVPSADDEIQIKGRTGRFGKPGEYRMIPNLSDPDSILNGKTYKLHQEIGRRQDEYASKEAFKGQVSEPYCEFLEEVHQAFFWSRKKASPEEKGPQLENWHKFLKDMQQDWDEKRGSMLDAINKEDKVCFLKEFNQFTDDWVKKAKEYNLDMDVWMKEAKKDNLDSEPDSKPSKSTAEKAFDASVARHQSFKKHYQAIKQQERYDVGDDAQARVYSSLFAHSRAILRGERALFANTRAAMEGRGILFADLRATLDRERPLFANLRATIDAVLDRKKQTREESVLELEPESEPEDPVVKSPNRISIS